jgi:hypothetical protein
MTLKLIISSNVENKVNFSRIMFSRDIFSWELTNEAKKYINEAYILLKKLSYPMNLSLKEEWKFERLISPTYKYCSKLLTNEAKEKVFFLKDFLHNFTKN